jgi:syntaxin 16
MQELRKCTAIIGKIAHQAKNLPLSTTSKEDRVMIQNVQTALATKVQNASTMFRKKQSNYLKREPARERDSHRQTDLGSVAELRGYELRNQDILAASGAIPIKDSYDSIHDDIELVRLFQLYRSRHLLSDVFLNRAKTP